MQPQSFVFENLIARVEHRVGVALSRDEIEADPLNGPSIITRAVSEVFGEPTTREALVIMSSIEDIDDYGLDTRWMDEDGSAHVVIRKFLDDIVGQRLVELKKSVAVLSFAAGFAKSADRLISLGETAAETNPTSKRISGMLATEAREALDRLIDKSGSKADLEIVLRTTTIFRDLLTSPKDIVAWNRHGLDYQTVSNSVKEFNRYRDLLGTGWSLIDDAMIAISNRASSELRPDAGIKTKAPTI